MSVSYCTISGTWIGPGGGDTGRHPVIAVRYSGGAGIVTDDATGERVFSGEAAPAANGVLTLPVDGVLPDPGVDGLLWEATIRAAFAGGKELTFLFQIPPATTSTTWGEVLTDLLVEATGDPTSFAALAAAASAAAAEARAYRDEAAEITGLNTVAEAVRYEAAQPSLIFASVYDGFFAGENDVTDTNTPTIWDNPTHLTDAGLRDWADYIAARPGALTTKTAPKVVWFGDSWIAQGAASILAAATHAVKPSATVVVSGVGGDTSTALLARFDTDVPSDADVVIFNEPGVNDAAGADVPLVTQLQNLAALVQKIRALGAVAVWTGHVPLSGYSRATNYQTSTAAIVGDGTAFPGADAASSFTALVTRPTAGSIGIGDDALKSLTTGLQALALGYGAALQATTGNYTTALGGSALYNLTTGDGNTAVGGNAGFGVTTGSDNVFLGKSAGTTTTTGAEQTLIGSGASALAAANAATALGAQARANHYNTLALGAYVHADHLGSVAIGTDSGYGGAQTNATNDFVLGTANHRYRMPGLPTSNPGSGSGILWNDSGTVKVA